MTTDPVRTLVLTRSSPYPPMGGGPLRNWQNINLMMQFGPVAVFTVLLPAAPDSTISPPGVAMWCQQRLNPEHSWRHKLEGKLRRRLWWLRRHGCPQADRYYTSTIAEKLKRAIAEFQPDVVVFEELWLYPYLPIVQRHQCRIIFDAHNVEASLYRQVYQVNNVSAGIKSQIRTRLGAARIVAIEQDFVRQADQVWVCSQEDANCFQAGCASQRQIYVIPNGVNLDRYDKVRQGDRLLLVELEPEPLTLIFTAAFNYRPNVLAAQLLLEQVYPQLRQTFPRCRLLLVGIAPPPEIQAAAEQDPQIIVTGKVPDVLPYLAAASVVIVPLLHGGGTRLKILEAFAAGRPVVSTTKGAEGLKVQSGKHLLIGDRPEDLVAGVSRLWSEPELRQKLTNSAYELVKQEYAWEAVGQSLGQACQALLGSSPAPSSKQQVKT